jgi:hypothetical protein
MSRDQELVNIKMCINQNMHKILLAGKIIIGAFYDISTRIYRWHYWSSVIDTHVDFALWAYGCQIQAYNQYLRSQC